MKASFLDLRRRMNDVLSAIDKNEIVTLTYRGKDKGVIYPAKKRSPKTVSSHKAFGIWEGREDMRNVTETVDELRRGRTHVV